jgi:nucleoid-associated protein EbfC
MAEMQEELARRTVTGEAGAGLVRVTATAKGEVRGWRSTPRSLSPAKRKWSKT